MKTKRILLLFLILLALVILFSTAAFAEEYEEYWEDGPDMPDSPALPPIPEGEQPGENPPPRPVEVVPGNYLSCHAAFPACGLKKAENFHRCLTADSTGRSGV